MSMDDDEEFFVDGDVDLLEEGEGPEAWLNEPVAEGGGAIDRAIAARRVSRLSGRQQSSPGTLLYFDLETIPDYSRLESFDLPPLPEVPSESDVSQLPDPSTVVVGTADEIKATLRKFVCPQSWLDQLSSAERGKKDRSTVHAVIQAAGNVRQEAIDAKAQRCKLLSVTPEYLSIAAFGWCVGDGEIESFVVGLNAEDQGVQGLVDERLILSTFWELAAKCGQLVAFNGAHFDMNAILVRSIILNVAPSRLVDMSPYKADFLDPYVRRFGSRGNTGKGPGKLKELALCYGLEIDAEGVDGSQVDELMRTNPELVGKYVRSDVRLLRDFHKKLQGFFWS